MSDSTSHELDNFMKGLIKRNPGEPEFHQAVHEVVETLIPFVLDNRVYRDAKILERKTEPDESSSSGCVGKMMQAISAQIVRGVYSLITPLAHTKVEYVFIRTSP